MRFSAEHATSILKSNILFFLEAEEEDEEEDENEDEEDEEGEAENEDEEGEAENEDEGEEDEEDEDQNEEEGEEDEEDEDQNEEDDEEDEEAIEEDLDLDAFDFLWLFLWAFFGRLIGWCINCTVAVWVFPIYFLREWNKLEVEKSLSLCCFFFNLYDTPGLATQMVILFFGPCDFQVSYTNRDTSWNAWNRHSTNSTVLWSIRGSYWAIRNPANVKWHSDLLPVKVASQPIGLFTNFMTLILSLTFTEFQVLFMEHLQGEWHTSRERLPFWKPLSVPFSDLLMLQLFRPVFPDLPFVYLTIRYDIGLFLPGVQPSISLSQ